MNYYLRLRKKLKNKKLLVCSLSILLCSIKLLGMEFRRILRLLFGSRLLLDVCLCSLLKWVYC